MKKKGILFFLFLFGPLAHAVHGAPKQVQPMAPVPEAVSNQTMTQKLQRYNEMSRRVHDRRFRGAADEDVLKVMPSLPKPERGAIGAQLQTQDNLERGQENTEDSGEQQHD